MSTKEYKAFLACYAKEDEAIVQTVANEIAEDLDIEYTLPQYGNLTEVNEYFETIIRPQLESADFILFFLTEAIEKDELCKLVYEYGTNINKRMIPLKLSKRKMRLKRMPFRSDILEYYNPDSRSLFLEQMHSWLGLEKVYEWSDVKFCSCCGRKINTLSAFCKWCGTHFDEQAQKRCSKCGNPLKPGYLFCNKCGNKIK